MGGQSFPAAAMGGQSFSAAAMGGQSFPAAAMGGQSFPAARDHSFHSDICKLRWLKLLLDKGIVSSFQI